MSMAGREMAPGVPGQDMQGPGNGWERKREGKLSEHCGNEATSLQPQGGTCSAQGGPMAPAPSSQPLNPSMAAGPAAPGLVQQSLTLPAALTAASRRTESQHYRLLFLEHPVSVPRLGS